MVFLNWKELPWYWHGLRQLPLRGADGDAGAGRARLRVRLVRLPLARHRRLPLDHHPGDDLRADARLLPQRHGLRRQQRPDRLQGHARLRAAACTRRASACYSPRRSRWCSPTYLLCRFIVASKLGRVLVAIRDAEPRVRFLGYSVEHYKLFVFVRLGDAGGHRRRALRAAGRHHQSRASSRPQLRSRS